MLMFTQIRLLAARLRWRSDPIVVLLVLWGLFIVYGTMLPFQFSVNAANIEASLRRIWEHPWPTGSKADVISNVLLFMPWGFLLATWRIRCGTGLLRAILLGLFSGFLLSGAVECAQLFTPSRTTSLLDLVTNTAGSTLGAAIGWPFAPGLAAHGCETQEIDHGAPPDVVCARRGGRHDGYGSCSVRHQRASK